ncbi:MAG TPA: hemolysin III family protein [Usitatibacter sp.]|nr:hemolysin III family protein [Usitatibacter sp.]
MYHGEKFNCYTHMAGAVLSVGAAATLMGMGAMKGDPWRIASFAVYGFTLVSLFLASTLYHATSGQAKEFLRKIDYVCIYLVIAGTYTPFALVTLNGPWGWTLFGAVWALALVGIVQELWIARGKRLTSLAIYVMMGWLALFAVEPLLQKLGLDGFRWMVAGGLVYTLGIVFYLYDERFKHWHGIWHVFVLVGSAVHYTAIVRFVA